MLRIFTPLLICVMISLISPALTAQSLSGTDLTTINIDNLSDEQLLGYLQRAESSGYTEAQLEAFARQRGMPESEIVKLRRRVEQLRLSTGQNSSGLRNPTGGRGALTLSEADVFGRLADPLQGEEDFEKSKIFGYELFQSSNLNFSPNLNIPTPRNYVLGPGDGLVVDLWGATQQYWTFEVSPEGTIRPQDLSPVYINGLTIKEAEKKVVDRLSQIYDGLKPAEGERPTIFYQVSLGNIRTINVTVVGEVNNPGNYALNSLSSVFTALHAAGGPTESGTFRSIRLLRDNKLKVEIDLYDFLVEGIKPNDELLKDGDVIIVKLFNGHVEVDGEVRRPGIFEVKEGESFSDLLKHAGGFTSAAFKSFVTVNRNADNGRQILNYALSQLEDEFPVDGDFITIRPNREQYFNRVQIEGAVHLEGEYELTENLTLKQLIEKANGPTGDAYKERATIYRMNEDFSQETIPFDLQKILSGQETDIPLMNEDIVRISSIYDLREEYYVEINGEVSLSGIYPYINNMTIEDIVLLAGGLKEGASEAKIEISRRNTAGTANSMSEIITLGIDKSLRLLGDGQAVKIEPFDQISVRRTPNYNIQKQITIEGEVTSPGVYSISRKDERISDIIERAGGLTSYAYPDGALLIRKTEFAIKATDNELNLTKLNSLKAKVLSDTSMAMNAARKQLFDRVDQLITKIDNEERYKSDVGSRIKKELTEEIAKSDSLTFSVELSEEEPTVVDLNEILKSPGSRYDYIIREGDVISIPGKLETVRVAGEVISSLNLRYDKSFSFKDYISDAGGFTSNAKKGRSYVQYPNGRRKQARRFLFFKFYPKVEPGSTIFVSRKPEKQPISLQSIIALTGSIATMALVVDRLSN